MNYFRAVHDVKTTSLGVEKSRFKAEIDFNGREITRSYLQKNCNLTAMLMVFKFFFKYFRLKSIFLGNKKVQN